jgi:nicotinamidase/pyrazinamidase
MKGKSMFVEREKTASFDVDPQRGFTPLCPKELPITGDTMILIILNHYAPESP